MTKSLFITLPWDKSYTLLVAPISGRFAVDQNHVGFDLQPATTESLGGVIVGDNLVITDSGRLSATGSGVAGVSSFNNRVGKIDLTEKDVSDALGFRPVQYKLPVATDTVLGGVKQGKNVTIAQDGAISVPDAPTPYSLPIASANTLGGIKIGKNLTVHPDGTVDAEGGSTITGVTTFNGRKGDVKLTKKDVTDVVSIPDPYDLPVASEKSLGGIKVGYNLEIKDDGTLNALDQKYSLPPATVQTLGGIIVGDNLTIDAKGRLSATGGEGSGVISFNGRVGRVDLTSDDVAAVQQIATKASLGVMKVGEGLINQPDGTVDVDPTSIPAADNEGNLGVVRVAPHGTGTICINEFDGSEALTVVSENICLEGKGVKTRGGGITVYGDTNMLCLLPATDDHIGGMIVGHGLVIQPDTDARESCVDVNVDGKTIIINDNNQLEAVGGAGGVTSFNKRHGDVLLNSQDILDAAPIANKNHLGLVKAGKNVTIDGDGALNAVAEFVPATATTLGGVKIGSGVKVTQDGTISVESSGVVNDEYTFPLYDYGMGSLKVTYDTNIIPNVKSVNLKKYYPSKAIYITVPKLMDSFYHEKDVLVWQMCTGTIKMQSNYDDSMMDVGVDCIAYVRTYTNGMNQAAIRVENDWLGLTVDVTKILQNMDLVKNGNVVIKIEPAKEATDTGETYTFGSKFEDEGQTVWKKSNLIGSQTLTAHKNQLFIYDYRLYKTYGNQQCVFNFDVPSNAFSRKSWSKTLIFRDNGIDSVQSNHTILFNVNARNMDVVSPFLTEVTGGTMQVKIPYTANAGDRIIHVTCYDNVIMVTGDTQTRTSSIVKDGYGAPVIGAFQKVYSPLLNLYIGIESWRNNIEVGYDGIVEWRIKGTAGGTAFDRVVNPPELVKPPYVDIQRYGIKVASMDTVPAFSGENMNVTLYTVDKNGNKRKSNMTTLKVPSFPSVTQPVLDQLIIQQDDNGWNIRISLKSDVSSYESMLFKYAVTVGGKTTTYVRNLTGIEYNTKNIFLNKKNLDPMPMGDWDITLIGLSKDNYSEDMTHQKFSLT